MSADSISSLAEPAVTSSPVGEELAQMAADVLFGSPFPALVLEVPSEKIIAASPSALLLLDAGGGTVVGRSLEQFTADRATSGSDLFAGGRLNGFEAFRVLRRAGGPDLKVRVWIRTFDHQPPTRFVLAVIVADKAPLTAPRAAQSMDAPAVVGTTNASLIVERISSDAETLFGWSVHDLLGRPLVSLVAKHDVQNCVAALDEAASSQNGVTVYLDVQTKGTDLRASMGSLGCEMLLLPLQPAPSCAFVFLPTPEQLSRTHVARDLSAILARLGRGAEIAQLVRGVTGALTDRDIPGLSQLTTRELEILTHLVDGHRAPAIANQLFLTQSTVRNHLASIFNKVGVTSQQQLLDLFRAAHALRADD
jgi:DNA-binding CsgD family transcriptional regulator